MRAWRNVTIAAAVLLGAGALLTAAPADAGDKHHWKRDWNRHEWRDRGDRHRNRHYRERPPRVVYVEPRRHYYVPPPVVYYDPPPVYYTRPSVNFVIPLRF